MTDQMAALAFDALLAACLAQASMTLGLTRRLERLPAALASAAVLCLAAALVGRGVGAGRWPLATRYEFSLWFVLAILVVYVLLLLLDHPPSLGLLLLPLASIVLGADILASGAAERLVQPVPAVLDSVWWQLHVVSAAAGYGAGASAGALAVGVLVLGRYDGGASGLTRAGLQAATHVAVEMAFPFVSLAILIGAIWAESAWGRYWTWSAKETWALVTWLVLLAYLHGRHVRGWRGGRLAWLALLGLGCILFSLWGSGWLARFTSLGNPPGLS